MERIYQVQNRTIGGNILNASEIKNRRERITEIENKLESLEFWAQGSRIILNKKLELILDILEANVDSNDISNLFKPTKK